MKLSKAAWNNVIIFFVMMIILLINSTNNRLFPEDDVNNGLVLPEHSAVLTLSITLSNNTSIIFERIGRSWQMTSQGISLDLTNQQIEQMMMAWQQSSGLVQAGDININGQDGTEVSLSLAGVKQEKKFTLYPLADQLLVYNKQKNLWLALPATMTHQFIPIF